MFPDLAQVSFPDKATALCDPITTQIGVIASQPDAMGLQMLEDELQRSLHCFRDIALPFMIFIHKVTNFEFWQVPADRSNIHLRDKRCGLFVEDAQEKAVPRCPGIGQLARDYLGLFQRFNAPQDIPGFIPAEMRAVGLTHGIKKRTIPGLIRAEDKSFCFQSGGKVEK